MDFQFTSYQGAMTAKCSMGHEAIANWLNTEVRHDATQIQTVLQQIQTLQPQQELTLIGAEYSLFINQDEVMVRANNLLIEEDQELEDDFHYYDEESIAFCGTPDFVHFLQAYLAFL
ncbi:YacL family protein [Pasteurella sp. PK-2025]|uniref:YacL family protein n=1 Tax=unclassified Pasteurella TaxID=2621516 RepID=UPI003C74D64E